MQLPTMAEDEPVLNITTEAFSGRSKTKSKLNRSERMRKNRQPTENDTKQQRDIKDDERSDSKQTNKTRKITSQPATTGHLPSFSSLFTNNPDIPSVQNIPVQQVKEAMFSGNRFADLKLHPYMVSNLEGKMELAEMTSVQQKAIPVLLQGCDAMVKSQTGSGKTLSYAVPLVQDLQARTPRVCRDHGPYAIVIVPTRELALQSYETFQKLVGPFSWIVPGCIMGGEKRKSEKARLRKGINILIATPGRLLDHITNTKSLEMSRVGWLVIDEADRLLDLGFEKVVSQIVSVMEETRERQRQTVLLSATLSAGVERLAGMSLHDPVRIDITQPLSHDTGHVTEPEHCSDNGVNKDSVSANFAVPETLQHQFVVVPHKLRLVSLAAFILSKSQEHSENQKMVVFLSTQHSVEFHHTILENVLTDTDSETTPGSGHDIVMFKLHGDMLQKERTKVFQDFCVAKSGVLFCTDVAARGLDLPNVGWIVQYNTPGTATDYIHRVGRTARIGSRGHALLFLNPSEVKYVQVLAEYKIKLTEMAMNDLLKTLMLSEAKRCLANKQKYLRPRTVEEAATSLQRRFELNVHENKDMRSLARKAFQSFVRAYAAYPSHLKSIFHVKHLHLGHVAKSFALQDAPTHIGGIVGKFGKMDSKRGAGQGRKRLSTTPSGGPPKKHKSNVSEFASGLDEVTSKSLTGRRKKQKAGNKKMKAAAQR
ncbi:hypothetical protein NP493_83g04057 [Ridgeia piscesae]|uniref:ATP-dependent RNA helicase n=1 Tax=Ridgeia piscesae TaxID=27915 RepID=A0AAD9P8Y4_RIDPI|nr:hypothetical protein NP493_83g04057 [Ridgeia piscesae]